MGCANSRIKTYTDNEQSIIATESRMGFFKSHSDKIDTIFKRFSVASKMNVTQFTMACKELNLSLLSIDDLDSPHNRFFQLFKENSHFDQRKLSTLGVVLGKGEPREKARVLFKIYDIVKDNTLEDSEIYKMISDITFVALIALPKLTVFSLKDRDKIEDLEKFNRKLKSVNKTIKNFYEIIILSKHKKDQQGVEDEEVGKRKKKKKNKNKRRYQPVNIRIEEFIEKFDSEPMKILCDAAMLRHFAIQKHSQVIAPREMVKDYLIETNIR